MSAIQNISLFIPHVYANISSTQIFDTFENLRIGKVKNVDLIPKQGSDGKPYNAAYIHFYNWCDNVAARNFQERVLDPNQEARIVYDDPWFWKVAAYREAAEPRREHERSYERREPERRPPRPSGGRMVTYAESRREPPTKEQVDRELDRINIANGNLLAVEQPKPVEVMPPPPRQAPRQKNFIDFNDHRPGLDTNPIAVNYDMTAINGAKKRAISIKKAEPVKVEDDKEKTW